MKGNNLNQYLYLTAAILTVIVLVLCTSCGPKEVEEREPIRSWLAERDRLLEEASGLSVQELVGRLRQAGDNIRIAALIELGNRDPGEVVPLIIQEIRFFDDYTIIVKQWSIEALPVVTGILEEPIPIEEEKMSDQLFRIDQAVRGIQLMGPDAIEAVPLLLGEMEELKAIDKDFWSICRALVSIGSRSPEVIDALLDNLEDENLIDDNRSTCYALGELAEPGNEDVIAALIHYIDRIQRTYGTQGSSDELFARGALYKLGWESEENFRIIRDSFLEEPISLYSSSDGVLAHIGNNESITLIGDYLLEVANNGNVEAAMAMDLLVLIGPEPEVKQYLARILYLPSMHLDIRPSAVWSLGDFGAESRDMLPIMLDFHDHYINTATGDTDYSMVNVINDAILRVYEGL